MLQNRSRMGSLAVPGLCLLGMLLVLFHDSLNPSATLFANDTPLGFLNQKALRPPACFTGVWCDLNTIGTNGGASIPNLSQGLFWLLGPLYFSKFFDPLVLLFLGLSAYFFFRQLKLGFLACVLGGLAVTLNSSFFSAACWGVGTQVVCFGLNLLALGILRSEIRWSWLKLPLAGLAIGMGVMEAYDIGALFSAFSAAFIFYTDVIGDGSIVRRAARGISRVGIVALFAVFIAAQALVVLIGISITGIAGTEQDTRAKAAHWDSATQWSLPKSETLALVVPGLFGYRMDTPSNMEMFQDSFTGGNYWGAIGRDAAWDHYFQKQGPEPGPNQFIRQSGGGFYAGVLVVLVALWAAVQSFRKDSVFTLVQRKLLWFWTISVVIALLLAFGRFAPFFQILYALPYVSTMRNPAKFISIVNFSIVILFAHGLHGLHRRYMETALVAATSLSARLKNWRARASSFDKRWLAGCAGVLGASMVAWLVYASSRHTLEQYLQTVGFDEATARTIAGFSIAQPGWFVLFFALAIGLLLLIFSGVFAGARAKWGGVLLGLLLVGDLGRANLPWIIYWNYEEKYATNPIIEFLREKPYEHRVVIFPPRPPPQQVLLDELYRYEWSQHHFLYNDIQSLDIVQMPRMPANLLAYETALLPDEHTVNRISRRWELTNTRYLLSPTAYLDSFNQQLDPGRHRFQIVTTFNIVGKPGIERPTRLEEVTAEPAPNAPYALIEFTGTLPRAKLYSNWQTNSPAALKGFATNGLSANDLDLLKTTGTNDFLTLKTLVSPSFDPQQTVLLAEPPPAPMSAAGTNQNPGSVEFTSYAPKDIRLKAHVETPSILLLNDKYDPAWQVWVDRKPDSKPAALLRANFIMRGVYLTSGDHTVEFVFTPPTTALYVSLAGIVVGILLIGCLVVSKERPEGSQESSGVKVTNQ
jgi:hypothetical protein